MYVLLVITGIAYLLNSTNTSLQILKPLTLYYVPLNTTIICIFAEYFIGSNLYYSISPAYPFLQVINTAKKIKSINMQSTVYYSTILLGNSYTDLMLFTVDISNAISLYNFTDPYSFSLISYFILTDNLHKPYQKINCFGFMTIGNNLGPYLSFCGATYNNSNYLILNEFQITNSVCNVLTKQELKMSDSWDYVNFEFKQSYLYSIMYKKCNYLNYNSCDSQIVVLNPYGDINMPIELFVISASNLGVSRLSLLQVEIISDTLIASDAVCSCIYFIKIDSNTLSPVLLSTYNLIRSDSGGYFATFLNSIYVGGMLANNGYMNIYMIDISNILSPQLQRVIYYKSGKYDMITAMSTSRQFICATLAQRSVSLITLAFFSLNAKNFVSMEYFVELDASLSSNYTIQSLFPDDDTFVFAGEKQIIAIRAYPQELVINGSMINSSSPITYTFNITASNNQNYITESAVVSFYSQFYNFTIANNGIQNITSLPYSNLYINASSMFHGNIYGSILELVHISGTKQPYEIVNLQLIRTYDSSKFAQFSQNGTLCVTFLQGNSVYENGLVLVFNKGVYYCQQFSYSDSIFMKPCQFQSKVAETRKKQKVHAVPVNGPLKYIVHLVQYNNAFAYLMEENEQYFIYFYNFVGSTVYSTYYYIYDTSAFDTIYIMFEGCPDANELLFIGQDRNGMNVVYSYNYQQSNNFNTIKLTQNFRIVFPSDYIIKVVYQFDSYFVMYQSNTLRRYVTLYYQIPLFELNGIIDFCKYEDYLMIFRQDNSIGIYNVHSYQYPIFMQNISVPTGYNLYHYYSYVVHYSNSFQVLIALSNPSQSGKYLLAYVYTSSRNKIVVEFVPLSYGANEYITYVSLYLYFAIVVTNQNMYSYRYLYNVVHINFTNQPFTPNYLYAITPNRDSSNIVYLNITMPQQSIQKYLGNDTIRINGKENNFISLFNYLKFFDINFTASISSYEYSIYFQNISSYYIKPPLTSTIIGCSITNQYVYAADSYGVVKYSYVDNGWQVLSESSFDNVSAQFMQVFSINRTDIFAILGYKDTLLKLSIQESSNNKLFEKYSEDFYSPINIFHRSFVNNMLLVGYYSSFNLFIKIYSIGSEIQVISDITDSKLGIDNFKFVDSQLGHYNSLLYLFFQEGLLIVDYKNDQIISYYSFELMWMNHTIFQNDELIKGYCDRNYRIFLIYKSGGYFKIISNVTLVNNVYTVSYEPPVFYPNYKDLNILHLSYNDYHTVIHYAETSEMKYNGLIANYLRVFSFEDNFMFPLYDSISNSNLRSSISVLSGYFGQFEKYTPFSLMVEQYSDYMIFTNYSLYPLFEYNYEGLLQAYEQVFNISASTMYDHNLVGLAIGLQTDFDNKMISLIFFIVAIVLAILLAVVVILVKRIKTVRKAKKLNDEFKMKS